MMSAGDSGRKRTYGEVLSEGTKVLSEQGIEDASTDAWYLLEFVTGMSRTKYLLDKMSIMDPARIRTYEELISKRASHIPLQHLTHTQDFMGLTFFVNENVLIPRQDTEVLVEEVLGSLKKGDHVLDLCTGSGCIAISLAKLFTGIHVTGADLSPKALEVAEKNSEELMAPVLWIQSDLFSEIQGKYDIIVSNPPYIRPDVIETLSEEVRLHEPYMALDGHSDGLYFYRSIISESRAYLNSGGWLMFEIGHDQGKDVSELLYDAGFDEIRVIKDLAGLDRVVRAKIGGIYV